MQRNAQGIKRGELNVQRGEKTSELSKIVRDAGYKDVNQFVKAFEKSCRLLEEYQKASEDKTHDDSNIPNKVLERECDTLPFLNI